MRGVLTLTLYIILSITAYSQVQFSTDYLSPSTLKDSDGDEFGKGSMARVSVMANLPFKYELDEDRRIVRMWAVTLSAKYASLNNTGGAGELVPDRMLNTSLNLTHIRPLSERWKLMASLGVGIYCRPNHVVFKSLLANGGAVFVYNVRDRLDVGVGGALTNSFGFPAIIPAVYLNWSMRGKYEIDLSMITGLKLTVKRKWDDRFTTSLVAFDMEGMSAVFRHDDKWKIYSTTMTRSYFQLDYKYKSSITFFGGIGAAWSRSSRLVDRKFKNFYKMFNGNDRQHFTPAMMVRIGVGYMM
ncbi:MAG: hypothetical protein K2J65_00585 [Duncaniella sp.]|nr:hypothetical protein [Duncaniella sp.]